MQVRRSMFLSRRRENRPRLVGVASAIGVVVVTELGVVVLSVASSMGEGSTAGSSGSVVAAGDSSGTGMVAFLPVGRR